MTEEAHAALRQQNVDAYAPSGAWEGGGQWAAQQGGSRACAATEPCVHATRRCCLLPCLVRSLPATVLGPERFVFSISSLFLSADCEDGRLQTVDPKTVAACASAQVRMLAVLAWCHMRRCSTW